MCFSKKSIQLILAILLPLYSMAQIGGKAPFSFVKSPYSAVENASGGEAITYTNKDALVALKNPSLLDTTYNFRAGATWGSYYLRQVGINMASFAYAFMFTPQITAAAGMQLASYGKFEGYDETGMFTESFSASDYQIIIAAAYQFHPRFRFGVSFKPILSYIETYSAYGILADMSWLYQDERALTTVSILARNLGVQLTRYNAEEKANVPFSIDAGVSQKLEHAPFRFSVLYSNIQKFDLSYTNTVKTQQTLINQQEQEDNFFVKTSKNFIQHVQVSAEFLAIKNVALFVGYNFKTAHDMALTDARNMVGFGAGLHITTKYADFSYGWNKRHAAGGSHLLSLTTNIHTLNKFFTQHDNSN